MTNYWEHIADCLRAELADYGGLLQLFEEKQRRLFARDIESVLRLSHEIEELAGSVGGCRERRERAVAAFAEATGRPTDTTLRALLPLVEDDARPLLEALVNEVNTLIHRVRRISRQNHAMLSRVLEMHRETLQQLRPDAFTKVYSPAGRCSVATTHTPSRLHVAG